MRLIGFADDICQNDEPSHAVAAFSGPKGLLEAQKKGASVVDGVSKSLIYSPNLAQVQEPIPALTARLTFTALL